MSGTARRGRPGSHDRRPLDEDRSDPAGVSRPHLWRADGRAVGRLAVVWCLWRIGRGGRCGCNQIDKRNAGGLADAFGHLHAEPSVAVPDRMYCRATDAEYFRQITGPVNVMFVEQFSKCHRHSIQKFLFFATCSFVFDKSSFELIYCTLNSELMKGMPKENGGGE